MIGIYFSGTGNTKHCVEKLVKLLDASAQSFPLEHTHIEPCVISGIRFFEIISVKR